jgi:G6PDH family F420-dependent oxidoreductase
MTTPARRIGYFLSCEEYGPAELVEQAIAAEQAGFDALWISDHYHPWNDEQGQSPFVWSVIGAIAQATSLPVTTAVSCPIMRIHPAVIAQAAATVASMLEGRFIFGVGSGEALNEHITGRPWPGLDIRLEMLEEAVQLIRDLWTGKVITHYGRHYTADTARIYTRPQQPPPIYVSGFGPKAASLAGRIGDGFITTSPDLEAIAVFREAGGTGKPMQAGYKVCWSTDDQAAVRTAHRLWANSGLPGELSQVLSSPTHFEQASQIVTEQMTRESIAYGDNAERHLAAFRPFAEAGFDDIYVSQMGGSQPATAAAGFFSFYRELLPELRKLHSR